MSWRPFLFVIVTRNPQRSKPRGQLTLVRRERTEAGIQRNND